MPAKTEKRGRTSFGLLLTLGALAVGFAAGGAAVYLYGKHTASADSGDGGEEPVGNLDKIVALGRIEPRDGVLSLGVPTPDRIARLNVSEGQHVKRGDLLAVLDSEVLRKRERKLAVIQRDQAEKRLRATTEAGQAQIRVEEARRDQMEQVEPVEVEAQDSKIKFLQAQEANAQKDYERYKAAGDTIAEQDREKQRLLLNQVHTELIAAQCQLRKILKSRDLNRTLAEAQLEAARAELRRGQSAISLELLAQQIAQADERIKETELSAPTDGTVLRILIRGGELVHGQPVLQLANTDKMIVQVEVYETDIPRVQVGQKATVTSHIFTDKDPLYGRVVWKGMSVGRARVVDLDPRAEVDKRVVEVKVELERPDRVADLIGHQVHVAIETGPSDDRR